MWREKHKTASRAAQASNDTSWLGGAIQPEVGRAHNAAVAAWFEADGHSGRQFFETRHIERGEVYEDVRRTIALLNEAVAQASVEPSDLALRHELHR